MFSFNGYKAIDLSPRVSPRINRFDGSIEEGATDPYGKHWVMWEGRFPMDNSLFTMYAAPNDINLYDGRQNDDILGQERMTTHNGSHIQGGKGHISHWKGVPTDMKGLWELPLDTFIGEAAVCNLDHLKPVEVIDQSDYPKEYTKRKFFQLTADPGDMRGQEILPDHLDNIQKGDIVLMTSPFKGLEQPWPMGRLDHDSEGLLLLSSDSALKTQITNPKYKIGKMDMSGADLEPLTVLKSVNKQS